VEVLRDLLDLHDCGERVTWPAGMNAENAKKILLMAEYRQEQQKARAPQKQSKAANVGSQSTGSSDTVAPADEPDPLEDDNVMVEAFRCPITQELMREPVITPSGHSYEGYAIRKVAVEMGFSPQTKRRLRKADLVPNRALTDAIDQTRKLSALQRKLSTPAPAAVAAPQGGKVMDSTMAPAVASAESAQGAPAPCTPTRKRAQEAVLMPFGTATQALAVAPVMSPTTADRVRRCIAVQPVSNVPTGTAFGATAASASAASASVATAVAPRKVITPADSRMPAPAFSPPRRQLCRNASASSTTAALRKAQASPATPVRKRGRELRAHESAPKDLRTQTRGLEAFFSPRAKSRPDAPSI